MVNAILENMSAVDEELQINWFIFWSLSYTISNQKSHISHVHQCDGASNHMKNNKNSLINFNKTLTIIAR